jgi:diguanylate cyclase (GGDEF)-like protein
LLNELGEMLQTSLAPNEAYNVVAGVLPALFAGSAGRIYLIKESRNLVESVAQWGPVTGEALAFTPAECWGLRRGRLHVMEHLHTAASPMVCTHLPPPWPGSYLCVPMVAQGETVGVLHLQHTGAGGAGAAPYWTVDRQQLARTVADSVGLALANLRLRDSLRQQSIRDPLTGLFNRRYLEETLERELSRSGREKQPVGIVMIDIDHFKQFNDAWGHEAGDRLLRDFGALLRSHIRAGDIACRYGGEEFTLILPSAEANVICERVQNLVTAAGNLHGDEAAAAGQAITISVGIALFPSHGSDGAELLRAADKALYAAKHAGRNRMSIAVASPGRLTSDAPAAP